MVGPVRPICARSVNPGYSVRAFPIWPKFVVPWVSGGLVYYFEDKVAYLEAAVLYAFFEVLRDSLCVSGHLEIRMVPFFLDQVQFSPEGFSILRVVVVCHSIGRLC